MDCERGREEMVERWRMGVISPSVMLFGIFLCKGCWPRCHEGRKSLRILTVQGGTFDVIWERICCTFYETPSFFVFVFLHFIFLCITLMTAHVYILIVRSIYCACILFAGLNSRYLHLSYALL